MDCWFRSCPTGGNCVVCVEEIALKAVKPPKRLPPRRTTRMWQWWLRPPLPRPPPTKARPRIPEDPGFSSIKLQDEALLTRCFVFVFMERGIHSARHPPARAEFIPRSSSGFISLPPRAARCPCAARVRATGSGRGAGGRPPCPSRP